MASLEPWPSLKDPEFIHFMQQYPSQLCKRTHMVLRKFAHGFIACKFSALAYLIIGILWLDHEKKPEEKIAMMKKMDIRRMGAFQNQQLESIFMRNQRVEPSKEINSFDDIVFEDNIALFGIVDSDGNIFHYFLLVKLSDGYSIYSSYGSDSVSIYQYETKVTSIFFENFVKSLKKKTKTTTDQKRIRGFMRAHFLNPVFQLVQRKSADIKETGSKMKNTPTDIRDEIERYVGSVSHVIQFQSILSAIVEELSHYESIKETELKAEKAEAEEPEKAEAEVAIELKEEEPEEAEEVAIELKAAEDEADQDAQAEEAEETKRIEEETKGGRKTRRSKYKRRKYDTYRKRRI
jgi:hypothetical protein